MSTSILNHGVGIREYRYVRSEYRQGTIVFTVEKDRFALRCPGCQGWLVTRRGTVQRWLHTLPIGRKPVYIKLYGPRFFCRDCKTARQITLSDQIETITANGIGCAPTTIITEVADLKKTVQGRLRVVLP